MTHKLQVQSSNTETEYEKINNFTSSSESSFLKNDRNKFEINIHGKTKLPIHSLTPRAAADKTAHQIKILRGFPDSHLHILCAFTTSS